MNMNEMFEKCNEFTQKTIQIKFNYISILSLISQSFHSKFKFSDKIGFKFSFSD